MQWLEYIRGIGITGALEIIFLWAAFYYTFLFFRGTRGAQVLSGLLVLVLLSLSLTYVLHLDVLVWLLQRFSVYLSIAVLIIFQPEIRRALAELGKRNMFSAGLQDQRTIDALVQTAVLLSKMKIGALIAIERQIGTRMVIETGTALDAKVSVELLSTLFFPKTPLHDGGVIIRNHRVAAAGCVFPVSVRPQLNWELGTRHRAAVGLTEETDALVVVVSEETGTISVAFKGQLTRGLDEEKLRINLRGVLCRTRPEERSRFRPLRRWLPAMNEPAQTQEDGASFGKEEGGTRG